MSGKLNVGKNEKAVIAKSVGCDFKDLQNLRKTAAKDSVTDYVQFLKDALTTHQKKYVFRPGDVVQYKPGFSPPYRSTGPFIVVQADKPGKNKASETGGSADYLKNDLWCAGRVSCDDNPMAVLLGGRSSNVVSEQKEMIVINRYDPRFLEPYTE